MICTAAALSAAVAWSTGLGAQPAGDAERGRQLFETKQCARCHARHRPFDASGWRTTSRPRQPSAGHLSRLLTKRHGSLDR